MKEVLIAIDSLIPNPHPEIYSTIMVYDLANYRRCLLVKPDPGTYGTIISELVEHLEANRRYSTDEIAYLKAEKAIVDTVKIVRFDVPRGPARATIPETANVTHRQRVNMVS
jgi:hypothetical protein